MLLSVIIYKHNLTVRQWSGAAIVFLGISIEAWVKRQGMYMYALDIIFFFFLNMNT